MIFALDRLVFYTRCRTEAAACGPETCELVDSTRRGDGDCDVFFISFDKVRVSVFWTHIAISLGNARFSTARCPRFMVFDVEASLLDSDHAECVRLQCCWCGAPIAVSLVQKASLRRAVIMQASNVCHHSPVRVDTSLLCLGLFSCLRIEG